MWVYSFNAGGIKCNGDEYDCTLDGFKVFRNEQEGMEQLENLLNDYVDKYGYDLKSIRDRYCQCEYGYGDLELFTELYNIELEKLND